VTTDHWSKGNEAAYEAVLAIKTSKYFVWRIIYKSTITNTAKERKFGDTHVPILKQTESLPS
jgi:hypothetical protein